MSIPGPTDDPPFVVNSGWVPDPEAVEAVVSQMAVPYFADTAAGKVVQGDPGHIYLWDLQQKVLGHAPPVHNQNPVGSCVSFGTARAVEKSLAAQIVAGDRFEFTDVCEEVIYGGSRVEVGGGRIRGDGSVCAWAAKFVKEYGAIPRGTYELDGKTYDLTRYDPARCRDWGRHGVPDQLEPKVREFQAGDAALVRSWAEAKKALAQGYGIAICSNQGFDMRRDANGVCRPRGSWAHCMCLDGFHTEGGKEYGHIENSWGKNAHTGPVGWGDPTTAGFWADAKVVDRMLRQGDSWAFSAVKGFPERELDWFVRAVPEPAAAPVLAIRRDDPPYLLAP